MWPWELARQTMKFKLWRGQFVEFTVVYCNCFRPYKAYVSFSMVTIFDLASRSDLRREVELSCTRVVLSGVDSSSAAVERRPGYEWCWSHAHAIRLDTSTLLPL